MWEKLENSGKLEENQDVCRKAPIKTVQYRREPTQKLLKVSKELSRELWFSTELPPKYFLHLAG